MGERGSVEPKHISILIEGPPGTSPDVWASLHIDDILDISDIQATYLHTHILLQSPVGASWTATTTSDWRGPLYKNHPNGEKKKGASGPVLGQPPTKAWTEVAADGPKPRNQIGTFGLHALLLASSTCNTNDQNRFYGRPPASHALLIAGWHKTSDNFFFLSDGSKS